MNRRVERVAAMILSACLHGGLLAILVLQPLARSRPGGQTGSVEDGAPSSAGAIEVKLVGDPAPSPPRRQTPNSDAVSREALVQVLIAVATETSDPSTTGFAFPDEATPDKSGARPTDQTNGQGGGAAASSNDILAQVQPCWQRALESSTAPVTLEINLSPLGQILEPPKVVHVGDNVSAEAQRISVERALQAVAACLPYQSANRSSAGGVYQLDFGVSTP